jgi:subtilisin family serine protease
MTEEERNRVISEDYADLLIKYSGDPSVFKAFPDATIEIINFLFAVVHIPVQNITNEAIKKFSYSAFPNLYGLISHNSIEASGIQRIRNIPNFDLRGQGVLLGIIDTGIDYTNPVFQNADGTTRIASIWDMTIQTGPPPEGRAIGTEYTMEQINQALQSQNPLEIVPSMDMNGHGTMVAGIAGGSPNQEHDFEGIATDSEFVVVKLKPAKKYLKDFFQVPESAVAFQENDILFAVDYLLSVSFRLRRPMVICISLGSSQGGHDGRDVLSSYISIIADTPGIAVVVAAGNEGNSRRHYRGTVNRTTGFDIVEINVGENEPGFSMELWGESPSAYSIDILSPSGEYISRIPAGINQSRVVTFVFEPTVIYVDYEFVEALSGDELILIRVVNPTQGIWRFNVYESSDVSLGFNIWLPMEGFISANTYFIRSDPYTTILSVGNAGAPITVTAYNYVDESLYMNSSRGYTRIGRIKPTLAAPGVNVLGPTLDKSFTEFTGTSVSAAHTVGAAAMILEWGIVKNNLPGMSTVEVKKLFMRGARRDANLQYPNRDWGYGILDIYNVFDSLRTGIVV